MIWLTGEPLAGAPEAVKSLRSAATRVLFATNNASPTRAELVARLHRAGIPAEPSDVVGSAEAAATMVQPGDRIMVIGEQGLLEALAERHVLLVHEPPADAVIVARSPAFDYSSLARATRAVRSGARLIGTSEDATHPTPDGLVPGSGSLLAAVSTAAGVKPEVAGKPHPPMVRLIRSRAPTVDVVVGDRPETDGALARVLEAKFALVLSGVTTNPTITDGPSPDVCEPDLGRVVAAASAI